MKRLIRSRQKLSELLPELDLRCGGQGVCGRCRVTLLSGKWRVRDAFVDADSAPCEAEACCTFLQSVEGEVQIPQRSLLKRSGAAAADWLIGETLPETGETVIAVDLGTTTVAAIKIRNGEIIGRAGAYNLQNRFGDNVISRINCAANSPADLEALQAAAAETIRDLLKEIGTDDAVRIAVAGNTVMSCLLHKIDPAPIGILPFTPPTRIFPVVSGRELGFGCDLPVLTAPAISGYVGGDLIAGWQLLQPEENAMLVDIGTNCEIIFRTANGICCTAAAAGPAFEGAGISCGCRAVTGAIDRYAGRGNFTVLGNGDPIGLCGSALIDFLAVEHANGEINEVGRYESGDDVIAITPELSVSEEDIAQLLKAKAAVHAGILCMEEHAKQKAETIYLAGGFARYLNLKHAIAVGMLPERNYRLCGNTSLGGAALLALQPERAAEWNRFLELPSEIPLNTVPGFDDHYIDGLMLP